MEMLNTIDPGIDPGIDPWGIPPVTGLQLGFHVADHNSLSLAVFNPLPTHLAMHQFVSEDVMRGTAESFVKIQITNKMTNNITYIQCIGTSERHQVMMISQKKYESFPHNAVLSTHPYTLKVIPLRSWLWDFFIILSTSSFNLCLPTWSNASSLDCE